MTRLRAPTLPTLLLALSTAVPLAAQATDGVRLGLAFGGTSLVAVVVEVMDDARALELSVGTWGFRDVSASLVGKGYLGASRFRPVVGAGLWTIVAWPRDAERSGAALLVRFPIGFDWSAGGGHSLDFEMSVSKGLAVRRTDPIDGRPMSRRFVPLPGISYRWLP